MKRIRLLTIKLVCFLLFMAIAINMNAQALTNYGWAKSFGTVSDDIGNGIALSPDGNYFYTVGTYARTYSYSISMDADPGTGTASISNNGWSDIYISKFDKDGILIWAKSIGSSSWDEVGNIVVDNLGNFYISGSCSANIDFDPGAGVTTISSAGAFAAKYDSNGDLIWAKGFTTTDMAKLGSVAVDNNRNVYLTGIYRGTVDCDPGTGTYDVNSTAGQVAYKYNSFFIKLDESGNFVWAQKIASGDIYGDIESNSIAVDNYGNGFATGYFNTDGGNVDFAMGGASYWMNSVSANIFLVKFSTTDGKMSWVKSMGSTYEDAGNAVNVDYYGNVIFAGKFEGDVDFDGVAGAPYNNLNTTGGQGPAAFVCKYTAAGAFIWAQKYGGGTSSNNCVIYTITSGVNGKTVVAGTFYGTCDFDPGTGTSNLTSSGATDIFVMRLDLVGNLIWVKQQGSTAWDTPSSIAVDYYCNNIYTTGYFQSATNNFNTEGGTETLPFVNGADIYISKLGQCDLPDYPYGFTLPFGEAICSGDQVQFSYNGPANPTWWTASTGGTLVGSGVLTIEQLYDNTTYYLQDSNSCGVSTSRRPVTAYVKQPSVSSLTVTACGSYILNNETYINNGTYTQVLSNAVGCDSTITLNLTLTNPPSRSQNITVCYGQSYTVGTSTYTTNGTYTNTIPGINGCDTALTTYLTVLPAKSGSSTYHECIPFSVVVGTNTYSTTGVYIDTLIAASGCDSVVTTDLNIGEPYIIDKNIYLCNPPIIFGSQTITTPGFYTEHFVSIDNCDSMVNLNVMPGGPTFTDISDSMCYAQPYVFGGQTFYNPGFYQVTLQSVDGCDSIINLTLNPRWSPIGSMSEQTICDGSSYDYYNPQTYVTHSYTTAGYHTDTLQAVSGCDSLVTVNLTIKKPEYTLAVTPANGQICSGDSVKMVVTSTGLNYGTNNALNFNPSYNNYISCGSPTELDYATGFSFEAWVYLPTGAQTGYLFSAGNNSDNYLVLVYNSTYDNIQFAISENNTFISGASWADASGIKDQWVHVAAVYDPSISGGTWSKLAIYFNGGWAYSGGGANGDVPDVTPAVFNNLKVGAGTDYTSKFKGKMNDVRFWNVVRTPNTGCLAENDNSGLIIEYKLDESTNEYTSVTNSAGSNYNGTLSGYYSWDNNFESTTSGCTPSTPKPLTYEWNNGWSNYSNTMTDALTYSQTITVTISDNVMGCSFAESKEFTIAPSYTSPQNISQCEGTSYTIGSNTHSVSGTYTDTIVNACGTQVVVTNLSLNPHLARTQTLSICNGSSLTVGSSVYTESGTYSDVISAPNGCDSTITTNLTVLQQISKTQNIERCIGQSYTIGTNTYTSNGTYTDVLQSATGCDSTVTTQLTFLQPYHISHTVNATCSYTIGTNTYGTSGVYTDVLTSSLGCDSTVTTYLTLSLGSPSFTQNISICPGETYTVGSNTYNTAGTYTDFFSLPSGCDSIVTTNLTYITPGTRTQNLTICEGQSVTVGTNTYTIAGTYTDYVTAPSGCDSVITTNLAINTGSVNITSSNTSACPGWSTTLTANALPANHDFYYNWSPNYGSWPPSTNNVNPSSTSTFYVSVTDITTGCVFSDSYVLLVNPVNNIYDTLNECEGFSLTVRSQWGYNSTYTTSGDYNSYLQNVNGCDSIVRYHLTILPSPRRTQAFIKCEGESVTVFGNTYSISGSYNDTIPAASGCDSIITTNVMINPAPALTLTSVPAIAEICEGSTVTLNASVPVVTGNPALQFDGDDDGIDLGATSIPALNNDSLFTIEAMVKPTDIYDDWNDYTIFDKYIENVTEGPSTESMFYLLRQDSGYALAFKYYNYDYSIDMEYVTDSVIPLGTWAHVAVVFDSTGTTDTDKIKLYLNGNLCSMWNYGSDKSLVNKSAESVMEYQYFIGGTKGGYDVMQGEMNDVRLWNVARTAGEINTGMNTCLSGNPTGLIANFKFDEGAGALVSGNSSFNIFGAMINMPETSWVNVTNGCTTPVTYSYSWSNSVVNNIAFTPSATETYTVTVTNNASGCTKTGTQLVTVVGPTSSQTVGICQDDSLTVGTNTYYSSGTYVDTITTGSGCPTIMTTNLTVNLPTSSSQALVECEGYSITVGLNTYNTTGIYNDTLVNANGCDSVVTTNLTILQPSTASQNVTECGSYTIGSNTYTTSGTYTDVLVAANGCDSTVTTVLTINPVSEFTQTFVENPGFSITVGSNTYNTTGVYTDIFVAANGCDSIVTTDLTINSYEISGIVTYDNLDSTSMNNSMVCLYQNTVKIDSVVTDVDGAYLFSSLAPDNYSLSASTTKAFGDVNATDALLVQQHFAEMITLAEPKLAAADVNASSSVNTTDALFIQNRFNGTITSFPSGDWYFNPQPVTISVSNEVMDFKSLCFGDVNGSYIPSSAKSGQVTVEFVNNETVVINNNTVTDIPVKVQNISEIGAVSLVINYPQDLIDISSVNPVINGMEDLLYNIANGQVRLTWCNLISLNANANDVLFTLSVKSISSEITEVNFGTNHESEVADASAIPYSLVQFELPTLTTSITSVNSNNITDFSMNIYPNPIKESAVISYSLPLNGKVSINLYDVDGRLIKKVADLNQNSGYHSLTLNTNDLAQGIYQCAVSYEVNSEISTERMVISVIK